MDSSASFRFLLVALGIIFQVHISDSRNLECHINDFKALQSFSTCMFYTNIGDIWKGSSVSECCSWTGVTCDNSSTTQRRVVELDLANRGLSGHICEALTGLYKLRLLNLSGNFLQGRLPGKMLQMRNMEVLDLSNNDLSGNISFPIDLPMIKYFNVSSNGFLGLVVAISCEYSPYIKVLDLSENYFSGVLPSDYLENCSGLELLSLARNNLSGNLPPSLFQLQNLQILQLQEGGFNGPLGDGFRKLVNIVKIDVSHNSFSGEIPDVFGGLSNLTHFFCSSNRLSGLPASLVTSPSLVELGASNNSLHGTININCSAMLNLASLDLSFNSFQGPIPDSLLDFPGLVVLDLGYNNLTGEIPSSFQSLQALTELSLSGTSLTNLSSALLTLQHCKNLDALFLDESFKDEEMPGNINLQFKRLMALSISNSQLKGPIPLWITTGGFPNLKVLDLSCNRLNGTIPGWISDFSLLHYLDLSNNSLSGFIPESITDLQSLRGHLSVGLPSFSTTLNTRPLTVHFPEHSFWPVLDLSNNELTGPIWPGFGDMKALSSLRLRNNSLSGSIPGSLSKATGLEILDFSHNNLSGEIPESLKQLHFLSIFDVSYNKLSGRIPQGGQFDTFISSSYLGNNLCGPPIDQCGETLSPPESQETEQHSPSEGIKEYALPFEIGAATGFILTVWICFLSGWVFGNGGQRR